MKSLIFENQAGTVKVEYVTDLNSNLSGNFQVLQIKGLSDEEVRKGMDFKQLNYNVGEFKQFAEDNYLRLTAVDMDSSTILVEFDDVSVSTSESWYE